MPSTPDLHTRLLAEIERREAETRADQARPEALEFVDRCTCGSGGTVYGHEPGCGYEPGLLWLYADDALRRYAHYRKVLERHWRTETQDWPPRFGEPPSYCNNCTDEGWPCDEIRDLAEALGIETGDADAQHP